MKLFKFARDALGSEFASRHVQYEMFHAGAAFVTGGHSCRTFDGAGCKGMVDGLPASDRAAAGAQIRRRQSVIPKSCRLVGNLSAIRSVEAMAL